MEPEFLLPCPREPATNTCMQANEFSTYDRTQFLMFHSVASFHLCLGLANCLFCFSGENVLSNEFESKKDEEEY